MWKGYDVGLSALHDWVKDRKPKPELCECCGLVKPHDLANISQEYSRDLDDWEWLCRACHMRKDGRLNNLVQFMPGSDIIHPVGFDRQYFKGRWHYMVPCSGCGKERFVRRSEILRSDFSNLCYSCANRKRWVEILAKKANRQ